MLHSLSSEVPCLHCTITSKNDQQQCLCCTCLPVFDTGWDCRLGPVAVAERPETAEPEQIDEEDIVDATQDAEQVVQEKLAARYVTSQR